MVLNALAVRLVGVERREQNTEKRLSPYRLLNVSTGRF